MKRRAFFKLTSAALLSAGLPLTLLHSKPCAFPAGYIREVQQYSIEEDGGDWRYDAIGVNPVTGLESQYCVQMQNDPYTEARREAAKWAISHRFRIDGLIPVKPGTGSLFRLPLPRGIEHAQYI